MFGPPEAGMTATVGTAFFATSGLSGGGAMGAATTGAGGSCLTSGAVGFADGGAGIWGIGATTTGVGLGVGAGTGAGG